MTTKEQPSSAPSELVPSREEVRNPSRDQVFVANAIFTQLLLQACRGNATQELPWITRKYTGQNQSDIALRHTTGVFDACIAQGDPERQARLRADWGDEHYYLQAQAGQIIETLIEERNKLLEEAPTWNIATQKRKIREMRQYLSTIPKDERTLLEERTKLPPEKKQEILTRWGITLGANVASFAALEGVSVAAGAGLVGSDLMHSFDLKSLLFTLGISYLAWGSGMAAGIKANADVLEQEGISTSAPSKAFYDLADRYTSSRRLRRFVAGVGYAGIELLKEIPYYTAAFGAAATDLVTTKESLIFLTGTNVGAAVYEYTAAKVTKRFLKWTEGRDKHE